jgi:hypothetical protein
MTAIAKPSLFAGLCVGCLALGGGAQTSAPVPAPVPTPAPPAPSAAVFQATPAVAGQGGSYRVAPLTVANGDRMIYAYGFGTSDAEALKLARQINDAKTEDAKEKLREKMKDVLDKAFESRQKRHEKEIESLEAQVKKLKEMVAKRKDNKREIIDDRIKQLLRDAAGLGW